MENGKLKVENYLDRFCLVVLTMLASILTNSIASASMERYSLSEMKCVSWSNRSQYRVSLASLSAMLDLFKKSGFDCACSASATKAPMAVPLRKHCFESTRSFFSSVMNLYKFTMRMAKAYDFSLIKLCSITRSKCIKKTFSIFNFQLSTV